MTLTPRAPGEVVLDGVSRAFGTRQVLRSVNLSLSPGSVAEIVGGNGAGKTSLLRIIAGTLAQNAGTVTVSGGPPGRGLAALVPAGDRALYWRLSVRQELEFFARLAGAPSRVAARVAEEAAAALALTELMQRQIGTLSTGQRRRVMMARSLVGHTPVLLLDEPYADLDADACALVDRAVRRWTADDGLVLWASPTDDGGPAPRVRFRLIDGELIDA